MPRRAARRWIWSEVIHDVVRDEAAAFREAEARLHVDLPATLPMVWGSAPLLTQALARIVANARQSVSEGSHSRQVWLTAEAGGGTVRVTVRDDGAGVPRDARDHLFEPFFTTHRSPDRMGLGLAVAHGIVEVHGGSLYLDVGDTLHTTFVIELPITVGGESLTGGAGAITPI
ncbi:MAG: HAMP domain-containing histidine kinase [Deltaproteobacteria bacterium]|nr:HAMP domain-containing histidine kinase [Deltaproteobacteria bacterium]